MTAVLPGLEELPSVASVDAGPRVYGLDLSLTATGMSDGRRTWLVRSTGHKGDDLPTRQARLEHIRMRIVGQIEPPALIVVEGPAFASASGHMHDRSGLWWLVVDDLLTTAGVRVAEVPPSVLKKYATGKGNANKGAMVDATARRFADIDTGADDNRCDALWLVAMGRDHLGHPLIAVPAAQRELLGKVAWPTAVPA